MAVSGRPIAPLAPARNIRIRSRLHGLPISGPALIIAARVSERSNVRAFTITAPNAGEVREIPKPEPGADQAVIKVAFVGICGTDYHIFQGDFLNTTYPLVNGHEFSGTIAALGPGVVGWSIGDRVTVDPTLYCGRCYHCLRRQANHCDNWGATGDTTTGALAEYIRVPTRNMYRVEDHETLDEAAFTEPLACVVWGVERLRPTPADRVLIFGAGPIGALLTAMLNLSSTADVTVVDVMPEKLAIARTMGARATFVSGPDLKSQLLDRTKGRGYDIVLDCTGIPSVIEGLFAYAAANARIMFFGVAPQAAEIRIRPFDVYHQDWQILGSMAINFTFQQARDLLAAGRIDVKPLITEVVGLEEVAAILARPKTPMEVKTLVRPNVD
jgi:2-desacetyl-2-hydroxyethyl bacteriochlorophyllide A dehydrogenase